MSKGKLYVVATPIGNLGDITLRALDVLKAVGAVACEDTRHTQKLLRHYAIAPKELLSLHRFNEKSRVAKVIGLLESGVDVAQVSDAGTPGLCDPGHILVAEVLQRGFEVCPIPGPSALAAALSVSGLDTDRFIFDGFLPRKIKGRREKLKEVERESRTLIFYEAPHRIVESLQDILQMLGNRKAILARELTKVHEEIVQGSVQSLLDKVSAWKECRGEMVLLVEGFRQDCAGEKIPEEKITRALRDCQAQGLSRRDAVRAVAEQTKISRKEVYRIALAAIADQRAHF